MTPLLTTQLLCPCTHSVWLHRMQLVTHLCKMTQRDHWLILSCYSVSECVNMASAVKLFPFVTLVFTLTVDDYQGHLTSTVRSGHYWPLTDKSIGTIFIYRAILGKLPANLCTFLCLCSGSYQPRSSKWLLFNVPRFWQTKGKTAFSYSAPWAWNNLQNDLKLQHFFYFLLNWRTLWKGCWLRHVLVFLERFFLVRSLL